MSQNTYNGWTNYATWRVNLEIFDGMPSEDFETFKYAGNCRSYAEDIIEETTQAGLGRDYALAFLSDVNWHEIASHFEVEWLAANLQEFDQE